VLLISEATAYSFSSAYLSTTLHSDVGAHGPGGCRHTCSTIQTSQFATSRQLSTARASFKMALSGDDDDEFYGDVMSNTFAGTHTHTTKTQMRTRFFCLYLSLSHTHPTIIQTLHTSLFFRSVNLFLEYSIQYSFCIRSPVFFDSYSLDQNLQNNGHTTA
jgi:hypothetical protein